MSEHSLKTPRILASLEAYVNAIERDPGAALASLENVNTPDAIRDRLNILMDNDREVDAAALAKQSIAHPHIKWADRGIAALVLAGETGSADALLRWVEANAPPEVRHLSAVRYAEALFHRAFDAEDEMSPPSERLTETARRALGLIRPIEDIVRANNRIQTPLEELAISLAIESHFRVGNTEVCQSLGQLLLRRKPMPLAAGRLAFRKLLTVNEDMVNALRADHANTPGAFRAGIVAAQLEAEFLKRPGTAFQAALNLQSLAANADDRTELWKVLRSIAIAAGDEARSKLDRITPRLIAADSLVKKKYQVERMIETGNLAGALRELATTAEDDPEWLQLRAKVLLAQNNVSAALELLDRAGQLLPHPDLLHDVAALALRESRFDIAERVLSSLVRGFPLDRRARHNLAQLFVQQDRFGEAVPHLTYLRAQHPQDSVYAINLAACLAMGGDYQKALAVYNALCNTDTPDERVVLSRASLMHSHGEPVEAFHALQAHREAFWSNPRYVGTLMTLAYAAGEEGAAHDALSQLLQLQREGKASPEMVRPTDIDEVLELSKSIRDRDRSMFAELLKGRLSWVVLDSYRHHTPYWAWAVRTQPLRWLSEDPMSQAAYSIYATNSLFVGEDEGVPSLLRISGSPAGQAVVADVSALITLHRLGLLDELAKYAGQVHVPTSYAYVAIEEGIELQPHQRSIEQLDEDVVAYVRRNIIRHATAAQVNEVPHIDEHRLGTDPPRYGLADIAVALRRAGALSDQQFAKLGILSHRPPTPPDQVRALRVGEPIIVKYFTLSSLRTLGWLEAVTRSFVVLLDAEDAELLRTQEHASITRNAVREWSDELWRTIRQDKRFVQTTHLRADVVAKRDDSDDVHRTALVASALLAEKLGLPLLSDDRVLQTVRLNHKPAIANAAFGSDVLLAALRRDGVLDAEAYAAAIEKLMRWRYRFLIPPAAVVKTLAERHQSHLPGRALRDVADYMHECLRDEGLLNGFEKTVPPTTCAFRFVQAWVVELAKAVVCVWGDSAFNDDAARAFTGWVTREALPSTVRRMGPAERRLASTLRGLLVSHVLLHGAPAKGLSRTKLMMQSLRTELWMDDDEYLRTVTDLIK